MCKPPPPLGRTPSTFLRASLSLRSRRTGARRSKAYARRRILTSASRAALLFRSLCGWLSIPRPLGCGPLSLTVGSLLAGLLLTQRLMDRHSPQQSLSSIFALSHVAACSRMQRARFNARAHSFSTLHSTRRADLSSSRGRATLPSVALVACSMFHALLYPLSRRWRRVHVVVSRIHTSH
jgi:hypothetical protein